MLWPIANSTLPINKRRFFSQYSEDRWIVDHLDLPANGVFVDVGAEDGVTFSNTYYFELNGWTGVCVEANPAIFATLKRNRRCACVSAAIGKGSPEQPFYVHPIASWSGLMNEGDGVAQQVSVRSLDSVLKDADIAHIDLLSVDTEGTELEVLSTLDWDRYRPSVVMTEWNTWCGALDTHEAILSFFVDKPYEMVAKSESNLIFKRQAR